MIIYLKYRHLVYIFGRCGQFYTKSISISYHTTFSRLKEKARKGSDDMAKHRGSILGELATDVLVKESVIENRKKNNPLK